MFIFIKNKACFGKLERRAPCSLIVFVLTAQKGNEDTDFSTNKKHKISQNSNETV